MEPAISRFRKVREARRGEAGVAMEQGADCAAAQVPPAYCGALQDLLQRRNSGRFTLSPGQLRVRPRCECTLFMEDAKAEAFEEIRHDFFESRERGHGRTETRKYYITDEIHWLIQRPQWDQLRSSGMVESTRDLQGVVTTERRFFLRSIAADAKELARAVCGHWAIENTLHWCLDVTFREDQCRARTDYAAQKSGPAASYDHQHSQGRNHQKPRH